MTAIPCRVNALTRRSRRPAIMLAGWLSKYSVCGAPCLMKSWVILGVCLLFALFQAHSADGLLVRKLRLSTSAPLTSGGWAESAKLRAQEFGIKDVERNNTCASACFFIYVAGVDRMGDTIGIHRPYFDPAVLRKSEGSDVIERSRSVKSIVESYLREMGVPSKYAELMFDTKKDEIRWLTKDEISRDFFGLIPELQDWVESRCGKQPQSKYQSTGGRVKDTKDEALASFKESQRWFDCYSNSLQQMRYDVILQISRERQRNPSQ